MFDLAAHVAGKSMIFNTVMVMNEAEKAMRVLERLLEKQGKSEE